MEITVKDTTVTLKNTFRSMIMYENIMEKSFVPNGITEILVYFYCVILASKHDIELKYEDFLDWIDENPQAIEEFSTWVFELNKIQDKLKKK